MKTEIVDCDNSELRPEDIPCLCTFDKGGTVVFAYQQSDDPKSFMGVVVGGVGVEYKIGHNDNTWFYDRFDLWNGAIKLYN
jgi:hypothetical protein